MARVKKAIEYIRALCLSEVTEKRALGKKLKAQYAKWINALNLKDFLTFNETIQKNKAEIGTHNFSGNFVCTPSKNMSIVCCKQASMFQSLYGCSG